MNKILVIIPAFNEEAAIAKVIGSVGKIKEIHDTLVVNDCSQDNTYNEVLKAGAKVINLPINLGIGGAMQVGYIYAKNNDYDYAIQIDGDGQHDAREIPGLIKAIEESGADLVIGSRFISKTAFKSSFMRRVGIIFFMIITKMLTGVAVKDATSGFRIANKRVITYFAQNYPTDYPEPEVLVGLSKRGCKIVEVSVKMNARKTGASSITALKSVYYMIKVFFAMLIDKIRSK